MSEKFYNKLRPIKPTSKEKWDIHERYREVSRSYFLEGKRGKEAHDLALRNLRTYF